MNPLPADFIDRAWTRYILTVPLSGDLQTDLRYTFFAAAKMVWSGISAAEDKPLAMKALETELDAYLAKLYELHRFAMTPTEGSA